MLRTPVKTILFLLLITLSTAFLSIGANLWLVSGENLQAFENSFTTIGTVRQKPNVLDTVAQWDAGREAYSYFNHPVYDAEIPLSVLEFENAGYIHPPEKRPYYGAYLENYAVSNYNGNSVGTILEAEPLEDCVPSGPVKLRINRVLYGNLGYSDEIWFCDHFNDEPATMYAGKTYIMSVQTYPISTHAGYDGALEQEYIPNTGIESTQYDKNGILIPDMFGARQDGWEEVTEGYYDTPRGQRWQELMKGLDKFLQTFPVVPTNATGLLMDFYNGNAHIIDGRDISDEEYEAGSKVCLVQQGFAKDNDLAVGDVLPLPMYYANYRLAASQTFQPNGGAGINFGLLDAQGKSYPVFEDGKYTIVGIYEASGSSYLVSGFESAKNMVVIPALSVENSDENNIVAYGPMQAYNTSFEIPNGTINKFVEEWNRQSVDGLEIQFYDKGYSQLKDGLDRMRTVSLILLIIGAAVMVLVLTFFTYLFISKNKKRTAIERTLGFGRGKSFASLLSGMLLLSVLGTIAGSIIGYSFGESAMNLTTSAANEAAFDLLYSNWVNNSDKVAEVQINIQPIGSSIFIAIAVVIFIISVLFASVGILRNLKHEPLALLSKREDE